jgi:pyrrolidone-carboxylate peptidase
MSEGCPYRPEGWLWSKTSSPAVLNPNAVILLGKRPGRMALTLQKIVYSSEKERVVGNGEGETYVM